MITIDGSFGEGGGQILRSAIALSILTQTPVRIENIRAGRRSPGLMRQHLTALSAAAEISDARVSGALLGSRQVTFEPGPVRPGEYTFPIGSAGSTTLVLQTVLLPLLAAPGPSRLTLDGGTHNPYAPPYEFLAAAYLPLIERMGPRVRATLERPGFYPAGGGRFSVEIEPDWPLRGFELLERGALLRRSGVALLSSLPAHIGERELRVLQLRLGLDESEVQTRAVRGAGPGNAVLVICEFEHVTEVFSAIGQVGRPAEAVAGDAAARCRRYLDRLAPADEYLTDQLLLPLAVAGQGAFRSTGLSSHARTHMELIGRFLTVAVQTAALENGDVLVRVGH